MDIGKQLVQFLPALWQAHVDRKGAQVALPFEWQLQHGEHFDKFSDDFDWVFGIFCGIGDGFLSSNSNGFRMTHSKVRRVGRAVDSGGDEWAGTKGRGRCAGWTQGPIGKGRTTTQPTPPTPTLKKSFDKILMVYKSLTKF